MIANVALYAAIAFGIATSGVALDALGWDLGVFRDASTLLLRHESLYDFAAQESAHRAAFGRAFLVHYPYAYPPIFAIECVPLSLVPQVVAFALVVLASIAALVWAARKTGGRALDALWVTVSFPAAYALLSGQLVFVALALFSASYALVRAHRPIAAGVVASLLAYKPQLVVVLPVAFAVMPRARRALVGLALGGAAQLALCLAIAPGDTLEFPSAVRHMSEYADTHFRESVNFTWKAFFTLLMPTHHGAALMLAAIVVAALGALALVAMVRAKHDLELVFGIAVLATLACAWRCAPYDWVLLALPAWLLLGRAAPSPNATRVLVALLASTWVMTNLVDAQERTLGIALHPAAPMLTCAAAWLVTRSTKRSGGISHRPIT